MENIFFQIDLYIGMKLEILTFYVLHKLVNVYILCDNLYIK
jgi:hypothetical protein